MTDPNDMEVVNGIRFRPEDKKTEFYKRTIAQGKIDQARRQAQKAKTPDNKSATTANKAGAGTETKES